MTDSTNDGILSHADYQRETDVLLARVRRRRMQDHAQAARAHALGLTAPYGAEGGFSARERIGLARRHAKQAAHLGRLLGQ